MAPGARVTMRAPESHASAFFAARHGAIAAARPQNCASCHSQSRFCQTCHEPLAHAGPATEVAATGTESPPAGTSTAVLGSIRLLRAWVESAKADFQSLPRLQSPSGSKASIGMLPGASRAPGRERVVYSSLFPLSSFPGAGQRGGRGHPSRRARGCRWPATPCAPVPARPRARRFTRAPEFHPTNYLSRHAAEAYAQRQECSSCHNTRVFCRDCHQQAGFEATGRLGPGFHSAEPVWLFRHSQAARQTLESCTSCHAQRDCMQCHSQLGSFQVSPHGRNFDAERARRRNPQICGACHLAEPTGGRVP
jgi:hypothetical protein